MNLYKFLLLVVAAANAVTGTAQRLRGTVLDAERGLPLPGAHIRIEKSAGADSWALVTDSTGQFVSGVLPPGYYQCLIEAERYESLLLREVSVVSGRETLLELSLRAGAQTLPDVTILAAPAGRRALQPVGEIPLTREQTLRFPATFFDPARLALAYPGVANTDDQANGLSIRGNGPAALRWRLEGVDVVNPNHLPNAGTLGDLPTTASGGVLLFSAQLLDNSSLLTGAFPAGYGDALGGIMDMNWRSGNPERPAYTVQAGLLGLDLAAEGPLDRQHRHSYLANYRYSTVGLLGQLGVSFGGEKINFQDFSFKLRFAGKKGGHWSVFGAGGLSENIFTPPADSADIEQYKDLFHIDFKSRTGLLGLSHWAPLGRRAWWKFGLVASGQKNTRAATGTGLRTDDESEEGRLGLSATVFQKIGDRNRLLAGVQVQSIEYRVFSARNGSAGVDGDLSAALAQPWVAWEWNSRSGSTALRLGAHAAVFKILNTARASDAAVEPRLLLTQRLGARQILALALGLHSQLSPLWVYADRSPAAPAPHPNRTLGFTRAQQANLRYSLQSGRHWVLKAEVFYQRLRDAPVSADVEDAFSILNVSEIQAAPALRPAGAGEHAGLELSAERYLADGWFLLANATLFDARYRGSDGQWRAGRWSLGHVANLSAGKEWQRSRQPERSRAFGVNGRLTWAGGQRAAPVDTTASAAAQTTVYDFSGGFPERLPDFIRLDLRVYWRRNIGQRRNSIFAMDFQNASIRKNTAYRYFDPYTGRVETKEQLGLVPNLSWRLEF